MSNATKTTQRREDASDDCVHAGELTDACRLPTTTTPINHRSIYTRIRSHARRQSSSSSSSSGKMHDVASRRNESYALRLSVSARPLCTAVATLYIRQLVTQEFCGSGATIRAVQAAQRTRTTTTSGLSRTPATPENIWPTEQNSVDEERGAI